MRSTRVKDSVSSATTAVAVIVVDDSSTFAFLSRFKGVEDVDVFVSALVAFRFLVGVAEGVSSLDEVAADGEGEGSPKSANERRSAVNMTLGWFKRSTICCYSSVFMLTEWAHPA